MASSSSETNHNRNPTGNNQYPAREDSEALYEYLLDYNRKGITDEMTSKLLKEEHDIELSVRSVQRRKQKYGIHASGKTKKILDSKGPEFARQLVHDQVDKDKSGNLGVRSVWEGIRYDTGTPLPRDFIRDEMLLIDPEGFERRKPDARKTARVPLTAVGPNDEWSGDGHDKLSKIGFPIWGLRDKWSGYWLGLWVVPNNRLKNVVAYLFLSAVHEQGGCPVQVTTDAGSETTLIYGFANALREAYSPDLDANVIPPHQFLKSIHNIVVERGWLGLRLRWGDNVVEHWNDGLEVYNPVDKKQFLLARWIWSTVIQEEVSTVREKFNWHKPRKDSKKLTPSGVEPHLAYKHPQMHGGKDCLQLVDRDAVKSMMEDLGGEDLLRFVTVGYEEKAKAVHARLELPKLTMQNAWDTFAQMCEHMPEPEQDEIDFALQPSE
ncbi:hypothetical protein FRC02_000437 [Tulasnella sp. 418]|nr:hypothetical protein FRC02_000437 [Tulasnella sp. 418]